MTDMRICSLEAQLNVVGIRGNTYEVFEMLEVARAKYRDMLDKGHVTST